MGVVKTVKQYSYLIEDIDELKFIAEKYKNVKNYVYSRYSGINSIPLINNHRKLIRDVWVKSGFAKQWKIPARYWKLALDESISNIKSQWSNTKRKIKEHINSNENLSKEEKHYIKYVLSIDDLYHKVLTYKQFDVNIKFITVRFKYVNNLIRRLSRKYKGNIPYTYNANNFTIDADMYNYKSINDKNYIEVMSTKNAKRIKIYLTDKNKYNGNLKVMIKGDKIEIHKPLKIQSKKLYLEENIIGVDKGYKYLLSASNGKLYGENLNFFLTKETERLNNINIKRNQLYALEKKYRQEGDIKKADNILYNNLGKIKYNKNKQKNDANVKSYINYSLNQLFKQDKPSEIVMENLDFVSWNDRYPKSVKRKLSRWIKGYIRSRLEYKCDFYEVKYTYVNPAYTSKVCSVCGSFGKRNSDVFTCPKCGKFHADINASVNILKRKNDKEIGLYTKYTKVKEILSKRVN